MTRLVVLALAAAVAVGVTTQIELGGTGHKHARAERRARHFRDGPVHGLMLLPLADPDRHVPTADKH